MMMMMIVIIMMMILMMMMMMMMMMIIIIIIIITFKGAIRDAFQFPHCAANRLRHVSSSGQGAIVCKSRATHRALITSRLGVVMGLSVRQSISPYLRPSDYRFIPWQFVW